MKKFFKSLKTWVLVVFLLCSVVTTVFAIRFLAVTAIYSCHHLTLRAIEREASEGFWTENGLEHWSESQIQAYEDFSEKKQNLIETSDIAMYLYHCGFSFTGKIARILTIFVMAAITYYAVKSIIVVTKIICCRIIQKRKRKRTHATTV